MSERPTCAVQGLIRRGAMCSQIIVGGKLCGYDGACEHQRAAGCGCQLGTCESKPTGCRMAEEVKPGSGAQ